MEDHVSQQIRSAFGKRTLYEIFEVDTKASLEEINKSYRRLALKYHPDRKDGDAILFQALSAAHSILSDSSKRNLYDSTGELDGEDISDEAEFWSNYFRTLFPKVTMKNLDEFSDKFKGSEEEREDIIDLYRKYGGNLNKIIDCLMCSELDDVPRLCEIIDGMISAGELSFTTSYEKSKKKLLKKCSNNKGGKKRKDAGSENDTSILALSEQIQQRRKSAASAFGGAMNNILSKYGEILGQEKEDLEDMSDEAFSAVQAKLFGKGTKRARK